MRVEVQAAAELNRAGEIQRLQDDALAAEVGRLHICEAQEGQLELLAAGRLPHKFTGENTLAHIELAGKAGEFRLSQIELFAIQPQARVQPVHRVDHGRALRDKTFEHLVVADIHHLVQMVEVTAQQVVPAVAFFKITAHAHELVGHGKDGFGNPLIGGIEAFFHNRPGIAMKILDGGFGQMHSVCSGNY